MISSKTYISLTKFGIVGGLSFGLDFFVYYTTSQFLPTFVAKSLGIIFATGFNYLLNKWWTWGQKDKDNQRLIKYIALYTISGLLNVVSNEVFLATLPNAELLLSLDGADFVSKEPFFAIKVDKFFAMIFATIVGMIINFIGQKLWVFKEK